MRQIKKGNAGDVIAAILEAAILEAGKR